ncbi:ketopantoate reductase family protein [Limobrevibacterium gyesilva]|uniref:2-dehydropantoate 2-reductase n=1 Tax=Limobrevibacterium gyesilva TaxID=2991712 RepID=A0AA41YI09_9PROT|nr:2-dehydropantoate 2-reductase [Limobrevibacterium gyesilva]MCW3473841.1 2-dehydropantoate 2-reductase [Limobrevibacterium gyesilva]
MRICVFGAGAIGGYLAGFLARSGADVSVVARGAHLEAIRRNGLTVEMPDESFTTRPRASDDPAALGPQDAVIVTVKAPSLPSVAGAIAPLLGPDTPVAFLTNGIPWWYFMGHGGQFDGRRLGLLDPGDALWNAVGPARVVGGIAWPASAVPAPGVVRMVGGATRGCVIGTPDGRDTPGLAALAGAYEAAGLPLTVTPRIRDVIWEKLAFNLSAGPMCVLTASPVRATHEEQACIDASRRVVAEADALIRAMGCSVNLDVERIVATNMKLGHRPSILQDLTAGRPMEVDALYTVPLELARMSGVAMPTLELLVALIKVRARAAGLYGA